MRYILDIPSELADQLNRLLETRPEKYRSPQDFFLAAIQNQVYLESQEPGSTTFASQRSDFVDYSQPVASAISAMELLQLPSDLSNAKTVPLSDCLRDDYLWGQYNRIFPVKVAVRVALNLARTKQAEYLPLAVLHEDAARAARMLGREIEREEKDTGRKRGEIISAGLPIGRAQDKAKLRFQNHFIGYLSRRNDDSGSKPRVGGAAPTLRFLDIKKDDRSIVAGLTELGLKFASMPNPVIESHDYSTPFSAQEIDFLLDHIATQLPAEAKLIHLVLSCIKKGTASPNDLNAEVRSFNPKWKGSEPVTMRSGVVSRISELGLLVREKDGVKVTYKLTELGAKYLARLGE